MSHDFLRSSSFWTALVAIDRKERDRARKAACAHCGGPLHQADYPRNPRGLPKHTPDFDRRYSLCCANCRRRLTPPSVRFMGRVVYAAAVMVGICALHLCNKKKGRELAQLCGVDRRTVARWQRWWREHFARSRFWRKIRGRFRRPPDPHRLPQSLLAQFSGTRAARLLKLLELLAPLSLAGGLDHAM